MEISFHRQAKPPAPPNSGGAGGFACRSNGHNQRSASKMNKFPKTVKHPGSGAAMEAGTGSGDHRIMCGWKRDSLEL